MLELKGKFTDAIIMIDDVEDEALSQIYRMINHPAFTEPVRIMVDVHAGKGSVIGFTMPLTEKIIPNIVGVDGSCGMLSFNVGKISENKDDLLKMDDKIRNVVPMGTNIHQRSAIPSKFFEKNFPWDAVNDLAKKFIVEYNKKFDSSFEATTFDYDWFLKKQKQIGMRQDAEMAIGTLGGGNHFLEVGKAETNGDVWITIHCGSRNFGKEICEYHQNVAKRLLDNKRNVLLRDKIDVIRKTADSKTIESRIQEAKKELGVDLNGININGMEYLEGQLAIDYFMDMIFINGYATFNRKVIADNILKALALKQIDSIECVHNYINFVDMIIRKGSISSYLGERSIIPFNMADGLLICEGKSNADWNFSAPHGSGRLMARGVASRSINLEDFQYKMKDVVSTSVCKSTLDESPQAYKNSKMIERLIEPTVTILDRVKPLLNIKDKGETLTWKERKEKEKVEKAERLNRNDMRKLRGK